MKVKVVSARSDNYWYADKIGETFEVIDLKNAGYDSTAPGLRFKVIESRSARYIAERDCVFILTYKEKAMKKSDLKSGMHVELRNGHTYIVLTDGWNGSFCLILIGAAGWASDYWDENLSNRSDSVLDIMKVYQPPIYNIMEIDNNRKLLWKREEKTPEQIQLDKVMNQITELQKQASQLQELINK